MIPYRLYDMNFAKCFLASNIFCSCIFYRSFEYRMKVLYYAQFAAVQVRNSLCCTPYGR